MRRIQRVVSKKGKVYLYDRDRLVLVKNGVVHQKNVDKYIKRIEKDPNIKASKKKTIINDLKARVSQKARDGENLTNYGFEGYRAKNKIDQLFANHGKTVDEAAAEYGIDESALRNPQNWHDGQFYYNGKKYDFNHSYTGDLLSESE